MSDSQGSSKKWFQSPKRYFLNAPKEEPGTCFVKNEDYAEAIEEIERLQQRAEQLQMVRDVAVKKHTSATHEPEVRLTDLEVRAHEGEPLQIDAQFQGEPVKVFAASFIEWFRREGGKSFVTVDMTDPTTREAYTITMQRQGGKTPAQELAELRAALPPGMARTCANCGRPFSEHYLYDNGQVFFARDIKCPTSTKPDEQP